MPIPSQTILTWPWLQELGQTSFLPSSHSGHQNHQALYTSRPLHLPLVPSGMQAPGSSSHLLGLLAKASLAWPNLNQQPTTPSAGASPLLPTFSPPEALTLQLAHVTSQCLSRSIKKEAPGKLGTSSVSLLSPGHPGHPWGSTHLQQQQQQNEGHPFFAVSLFHSMRSHHGL